MWCNKKSLTATFITDPLPLTVSELERSVEGILQTQNKILQNQEVIFERLRALEKKFRTHLASSSHHLQAVSTSNPANNKAPPRNRFVATVPSPDMDWYKENEGTPCGATPTHQHHAPPQPNAGFPPHSPATPQSNLRQPHGGQQLLSVGQGILSPLPQMGSVRTPTVTSLPQEKCPALDSSIIDKAELLPVKLLEKLVH